MREQARTMFGRRASRRCEESGVAKKGGMRTEEDAKAGKGTLCEGLDPPAQEAEA